MLKIGIVGCGLQAATIASYVGIYNDEYEVTAVADINIANAKSRMAQKSVCVADDCKFFETVEDFIAAAPKLDGIIIGTFCSEHTDIACKLEPLGIPLYIEKPVSVSLDQIRKLYRTFKDSSTPVEVSLPMRLCPLVQQAKKIISDGAIGAIHQIVGYEDTQGEIYFSTWFRDFEKTGGMFMQKAVHDIDYMFYLSGSKPSEVCAMRGKTYHKGDKPYDLTCEDCDDKNTCPQGPLSCFREQGRFDSVKDAVKERSYRMNPDGVVGRKRYCVFSKDIAIEDIGECIFRLDNGSHLTHTQNFIANHKACRRGCRICGSLGTLEVNFEKSELRLFSHVNNALSTYEIDEGKLSHYGGDRELIWDYIQTMKTGKRGRTDLIYGDGITATLACLTARESADTSKFLSVEI